MTARFNLLRLTSRLIARRDALRKALDDDLGSLRQASDGVGHADQLDAAVDSANDEICSRLAEIESRELAQIEQALQRIAEGGYGRCVSCGGKIPASRLNALPYTTRCIGCQRRDELLSRAGAATRVAERWARVNDEPEINGGRDPMVRRGRAGRFELEEYADTRLAPAMWEM